MFKPIKVWLVCAETVADQVDIYLKPDDNLKADKDDIQLNQLEKEANIGRDNRGRNEWRNNNGNNN